MNIIYNAGDSQFQSDCHLMRSVVEGQYQVNLLTMALDCGLRRALSPSAQRDAFRSI